MQGSTCNGKMFNMAQCCRVGRECLRQTRRSGEVRACSKNSDLHGKGSGEMTGQTG